MLYDKRWDEPKVKADPFSLESLIAWLEKQPADQPYCYEDTGACLYHQYFTAMGLAVDRVGGTHVVIGGDSMDFPNADFWHIAAHQPHTFCGALDRARKVVGPQDHGSSHE